MFPSLIDLGWRPDFDVTHLNHSSPVPIRPARVTRAERGGWRVDDGAVELRARARSRGLAPTPVTGDWVAVSADEPDTCLIESVLPRRTTLSRAEAGGSSREQVIAANVDLVAICAAADAVNLRRIERELTSVWASGAVPIIVITKSDTVADPSRIAAETSATCIGADVMVVSSLHRDGLADVIQRLTSGITIALIGPSGVGKSTLVNALAGGELLATGATRSDGKGRHTTTSRHLVRLPTGGLLLDTPGMREFAPWAGDDDLSGTFGDIDDLARACRFGDCGHDFEPGCAVRAAADGDEQVRLRLDSWRKLQRELAWLERRNDSRLRAEERRRFAAMTRSVRGRSRP